MCIIRAYWISISSMLPSGSVKYNTHSMIIHHGVSMYGSWSSQGQGCGIFYQCLQVVVHRLLRHSAWLYQYLDGLIVFFFKTSKAV